MVAGASGPADAQQLKAKNKRVVAAKKQPTPAPTAKGQLQIVISIDKQQVTLYDDGVPIAHSVVSTGVPGHPTPTGIFSVIEKDRFHRSNLYSNAPMPFMQRITWSGVALHEGVVPGVPASHGCIRLKQDFAEMLWGMTKLGVRVIIARNELAPSAIVHPRLFTPRPTPTEAPIANEPPQPPNSPATNRAALPTGAAAAADATITLVDGPRPGNTDTAAPIKTADATATATDAPTPTDRTVDASAAGQAPPPTQATEVTGSAKKAVKIDPAEANTRDPAKTAELPRASTPLRAQDEAMVKVKQLPSLTGPIAVFVSRKTGRLYVRQGFQPLFDVPVTIRNPELPLGTHVFTALGPGQDGTGMRWNVVSVPDTVRHEEPPTRNGKKLPRKERDEQAARVHDVPLPPAPVALDRVEIPPEAVNRISELLLPGSSLTISDQGIGPETGRGTDFIVVTR